MNNQIDLLMFELIARKHLLPTFKAIANLRTMHSHFPELESSLHIPRSLYELSLDILDDYENLIKQGLSIGEAAYKLVNQHNYKAYIALGQELEEQRKKGKR